MSTDRFNRRMLIMCGSALAATVVPISRRSVAWASISVNPATLTSGTWFEQVKAQHAAIAATLTEIITEDASVGSARTSALKQLSYLLTAHSVAEENVLYPALVFAGLTIDSADLYLEQQFQKVGNAEIDSTAQQGQSGAEWIGKVKRLQAAILEHAKEHEEGDYYPKLQSKLSDTQNEVLTTEFREQFLSIQEPS